MSDQTPRVPRDGGQVQPDKPVGPTATPDGQVRTPTRTRVGGVGQVGAAFEDMVLLGYHLPEPMLETSNNPLDPDRKRSGFPGQERCGAMGVRDLIDGDIVSRVAFPCWLRPNHGGTEHEGVGGVWMDEGDPRGVKTVWPGRRVAPSD